MADKIIVPTLGESLTEATVATWLKQVGDSVQADEAIVSLETDKVSIDVTAPKPGILSEISAKEGVTVKVGAQLGSIDSSNSAPKKQPEENKLRKNKIGKDMKIDKKPKNILQFLRGKHG